MVARVEVELWQQFAAKSMRNPPRTEDNRRYGELDRVRWLRTVAAAGKFPHLRVGIGDDAAILRTMPGDELVVTTDFCIEGVHFRRDWHTPQQAGHRCLARGLSDLAAMGATPVSALLSPAVRKELAGRWADGFFNGLLALAAEHRVPLAGGDLAQVPDRAVADIVLLGSLPAGKALLRSTARAGDAIYVTGTLGGAAAELAALARHGRPVKTKPAQAHPHLLPRPRIAAGTALRKLGLRAACMDISDGLALDLARLCEASDVHAEIESARLPIADGATLQQALTGGEDYELLFTAPASATVPMRLGGVNVTRIGRVLRRQRGKSPMTLVQLDGKRQPLRAAGWQHFNEPFLH